MNLSKVRYQVRFVVEMVEVSDVYTINTYVGEVSSNDGPLFPSQKEAEAACLTYYGIAKKYEEALGKLTGRMNNWVLAKD